MGDFRNPAGVTRLAIILLLADLAFGLLGALLRFVDRVPGGPGDVVAVVELAILIACLIVVGRWIYVANANAHGFATEEMSISPGWAVGWFFIPLANLVKPYEGMKETWRASHNAAGLFEEAESPVVGWWWGLWIANGIVGWVGMQLARGPVMLDAAYYFDLAGAVLNAALCAVLIRLMRRLAATQVQAAHGGVFA
jgi:hypothetical protein